MMRRCAGTAVVCLLAMVALSQIAVASCELDEGPRVAVARVIDGETLRLDDGREVRLIGALAPRAFDSGADAKAWPPEQAARAALESLVAGRTVELAFGARRSDRYGRLMAHVFLPEGEGRERTWVQGAMIESGHARAYGLTGASDCLDLLMGREAIAMTNRRGLWVSAAYAVRDAARTFELLRHRATFQIVEGRVRGVARSGSRLYVNFGEDWRRDFTIGVPLRGRRGLGEDMAGLPPLDGRRVRVRGWIDRRNGPFIELADVAALEVLDTGVPATGAAAGPGVVVAPAEPDATWVGEAGVGEAGVGKVGVGKVGVGKVGVGKVGVGEVGVGEAGRRPVATQAARRGDGPTSTATGVAGGAR